MQPHQQQPTNTSAQNPHPQQVPYQQPTPNAGQPMFPMVGTFPAGQPYSYPMQYRGVAPFAPGQYPIYPSYQQPNYAAQQLHGVFTPGAQPMPVQHIMAPQQQPQSTAASTVDPTQYAKREKKIIQFVDKAGKQLDISAIKKVEVPATSSPSVGAADGGSASPAPSASEKSSNPEPLPPPPISQSPPNKVDLKSLVLEKLNSPAQKPVSAAVFQGSNGKNEGLDALKLSEKKESTTPPPAVPTPEIPKEQPKQQQSTTPQPPPEVEKPKIINTAPSTSLKRDYSSSSTSKVSTAEPANKGPQTYSGVASKNPEPLSAYAIEQKKAYNVKKGRIVYSNDDFTSIRAESVQAGKLNEQQNPSLYPITQLGEGDNDNLRQKQRSTSPQASFPNKFSSSNRGRADQANDTDEWRTSKPTSGVMARAQPAFVHDPNAWRPSKATDEHQVAIKKVKGILNKLTRDNYEKLCVEMSNIIFPSLQAYEEMVGLIFEKALSEPHFVVIYAELCAALSKNSEVIVKHFTHIVEKEGSFYWTKNKDETVSDSLSEPFPTQEKAQENMKSETNFRKILLSRCQKEFESENNLSDVDAKIQETKGELSTCKDDVASPQTVELNAKLEELVIERTKIKRKMLGNIKFIGELYKQKLIAEKVIHQCIHTLLKDGTDPEEEDIECLCKLLQVVGSLLDAASINTKKNMDEYFVTLNTLSQNKELNSRFRFMIKDVIDLRKDNWKARREQLQVKTKEQIHQDAAREEIEKSKAGGKGQQNFGKGGYQSNQYQGGQKGNMGPMFGKAAFVSNQKTQSQNSQDFRMAGKDLQNAASASGKAGEVSLRPSFGSSRGNRNNANAGADSKANADKLAAAASSGVDKTSTTPPPEAKRLDEKNEGKIKSAFTDYLSTNDMKEFRESIAEITEKGFSVDEVQRYTMKAATGLIGTKKEDEVEKISELVVELAAQSESAFTLPSSVVRDVLTDFISKLPDVVVDSPKAEICTVNFVSKLIIKRVLKVSDIQSLMDKFPTSDDEFAEITPLDFTSKIFSKISEQGDDDIKQAADEGKKAIEEKYGKNGEANENGEEAEHASEDQNDVKDDESDNSLEKDMVNLKIDQ